MQGIILTSITVENGFVLFQCNVYVYIFINFLDVWECTKCGHSRILTSLISKYVADILKVTHWFVTYMPDERPPFSWCLKLEFNAPKQFSEMYWIMSTLVYIHQMLLRTFYYFLKPHEQKYCSKYTNKPKQYTCSL